jgi:ParB family chromosome partitioning protein
LNLPKEITSSLRSGKISAGHGRAILMAKTKEAQLAMWKQIVKDDLSVRAAEKLGQSKQISRKKIKVKSDLSVSDPVLRSIEDKLIQLFSTKVKIRKIKKGGVIEISYYSDDDFDRIYSLIKSLDNK